ncbi:hypothetical protein [Actinoallomurus sp. NPDC052274]|uniref:hypothetical protein n=1 Tax=Actinoallomurus sp. NPDC052274 TaxID=3155420 RepID=UPI003435598E
MVPSFAYRLIPSRLAARPARLRKLPDDKVAAILIRYCNSRRHVDHVFDAVVAEMERRDRLIADERAARARVQQQLDRDARRRTRDERLREEYQLYVEAAYQAAEEATRGHMLNRVGETAGVRPRELFSGPWPRARKYASEELLAWWEDHGRMTFTEFKRQSRQSAGEVA